MSDPVNRPAHYNQHPSGVECITVTEHMNFNLGNAVKYIWRAGLKSDAPVTDLKKALWYVQREIGRLDAKPSFVAVAGKLSPDDVERLKEEWRTDGAKPSGVEPPPTPASSDDIRTQLLNLLGRGGLLKSTEAS